MGGTDDVRKYDELYSVIHCFHPSMLACCLPAEIQSSHLLPNASKTDQCLNAGLSELLSGEEFDYRMSDDDAGVDRRARNINRREGDIPGEDEKQIRVVWNKLEIGKSRNRSNEFNTHVSQLYEQLKLAKTDGPHQFTVKRGDVVAIPTHAIPYCEKYEMATDSSSEYSQPPEDIRESHPDMNQNRTERIMRSLLSLGFDYDGRLLSDDIIFDEPDQAAAFTPMVICSKPVEIECVCLWDYFGGDTCMDVNCWAGTEMNVVAEEYQIRPLSQSEFLRLPLRWSLVRIVSDQPQAALGLIPSCWLVAKKFLQENPGLFSYPYWYLGICDVDTAYNHLISDRSAQRPDPSSISDSTFYERKFEEYRRNCAKKAQKLKDTNTEAAKSQLQLTKTSIKEARKSEVQVSMKLPEDKKSEANEKESDLDRLAELVSSPFRPFILTITRSISGHYELFGNRYNTLYDLVYHLSQTKSELPHKLLYGTLSKPPPLPFCAVPPPMEQPRRDPRANLMHCEQWAARQFDQAVLPSLLATPFQHVSRSVVDPFKQLHMKILKTAGISDKGKRAVMVNGVTIQKEITSYMEKFDRPIKKEKQRDNEGKEQEKLAKNKPARKPLLSWTDCPKDEFCIVADRSMEVDQDDLIVDRMRQLGKGAFGAVYAGEFKTRNGNTVAVAVKSLRLVCTDKDQRLPWIAEVEMSQQLKHPNVVRFFGFTLEAAESNILLIFEMMDKGALDSFCRVKDQLPNKRQRNGGLVVSNRQRYILKITDFGISKRTRSETFATYDDPNKIPFKWLPPEVLKSREMTPKADVWSFGMLVHELYGIGEPYGMLGPEKVIHALNAAHMDIISERIRKQEAGSKGNDKKTDELMLIDRH
uniref:Protein kinase domain-containing protein n=1 Tax=Angiostrongylus cantonensis TaxID=6313 RepID=A0A158P5U8_ANGCA